MDHKTFLESVQSSAPPGGISPYLEAMWYDARGDWNKAHVKIQDIEDETAAWIHAYLHRKEGDIGNADYWYNRAKRKRPSYSLEQEWEVIVLSLVPFIKPT